MRKQLVRVLFAAVLLLSVTPLAAADLSIGGTATDPVEEGNALTVTMTATLNTAGTATGVRMVATMTLVATPKPVASGSGWTCTTEQRNPGMSDPNGLTTVTCTRDSMTTGSAPPVSFSFMPPTSSSSYRLPIRLGVYGSEIDPTDGNNTITIEPLVKATTKSADLRIVKTFSSGSPAMRGPAYWTLTVTNNGPDAASSIRVQDALPAVIKESISGAGWTCFGAGSIECRRETLAAGASSTITINVTVFALGPLTNTATVSAGTPDPDGSNNSSTHTTTVVQRDSDLAVTLSGPAAAHAGGNATYTVNVKNNGPDEAVEVGVSKDQGENLVFASNSGDCTSALPCKFASIPSGATRTFQSTFAIPPITGPAFKETIAMKAESVFIVDPNHQNDRDSFQTVITPCLAANDLDIRPDGTTMPQNSGMLTWPEVGGARYTVYFGEGANGCSNEVSSTHIVGYRYRDLKPNTTYSWRVVVTRPGCPSVESTCATFRTCGDAPTLTLANPPAIGDSVALAWSAVPGAFAYRVLYWPAGDNAATPSEVTVASPGISLTVPPGTYSWAVEAMFTTCAPARSETGTFKVVTPARRRPSRR